MRQFLIQLFPSWEPLIPTSFGRIELMWLALLAVPLYCHWRKLQPRLLFHAAVALTGSRTAGLREMLLALSPRRWFNSKKITGAGVLGAMPDLMIALVFLGVVGILMEPQQPQPKQRVIKNTIIALLINDCSGSMSSEIENNVSDPEFAALIDQEVKRNKQKKPRRFDIASAGSKLWIKRRLKDIGALEPRDWIGLFGFGNSFYLIAVPQDDGEMLTAELDMIHPDLNEGTNFEGPTRNSQQTGCIQGPVDHIRHLKAILKKHGITLPETVVAIVLTDGESNISEERFADLRRQVDELGMFFYVFGIGDSWTKTPPNDATKDIRRFVDAVNFDAEKRARDRAAQGDPHPNDQFPHAQVIPIKDAEQMMSAYASVEKLHRSPVAYEEDQGFREESRLFSWMILTSIFAGGAASLLVGRRI